MSKNKTLSIHIGLSDKQRSAVIEILNLTLADTVLLYLKTRNFHWNVEGPQFTQLHQLFEQQYEQLDEAMDEIAERARALQGRAAGSMAEFSRLARLKETKGQLSASAMLEELLADHESIIRQLRKDSSAAGECGDAGSEDFLVGLLQTHEKMAWMLRSHLR